MARTELGVPDGRRSNRSKVPHAGDEGASKSVENRITKRRKTSHELPKDHVVKPDPRRTTRRKVAFDHNDPKSVQPAGEVAAEVPGIMGLPADLEMHGAALKAQEYWHLPRAVWEGINSRATGKGILIANLDTGYNPNHPLIPKPKIARSFVKHERNAFDDHGHGSHTIGTNCGRDPSISPAFEADLLVGKVLGKDGSGGNEGIASAIFWAIKEGAQIISASLGGKYPDPQTKEAAQACEEAGVLLVAAAGNDGYKGIDSIGFPGGYQETFCIGAYREDGRIASFSSGGRAIDIACPGQNIVSCSPNGKGMAKMSGTSMATPFAAALFALILELMLREGHAWPKGTAWWRKFIGDTCEDRGEPGEDDRFGMGVPLYEGIVDKLSHDELQWT